MKTILVTGASSGMGADFAKQLAEQGHRVYAAARRVEKMAELKVFGVKPIKMDITDENDIQAVVRQIEEETGGIDILVNNAGFGLFSAMEDTPLELAKYQFDVNLFGLARLTQLVLPHMRAQRSGKIINITSIGGKIYTPLGSWYHATKHALEGWSDCLRLELAQFDIDVVIIEPGAIATEFNDVMAGHMEDNSSKGAYAELTRKLDKVQNESKNVASPPSVITKLVLKAVAAKKPKTRYAAGAYAKPLLFIRKWFSDRMFDRTIMSMVK
tara:strand:+ start:210 stop:1019 length:810 start_codon:yes stop_codon:yes gene_type:complete